MKVMPEKSAVDVPSLILCLVMGALITFIVIFTIIQTPAYPEGPFEILDKRIQEEIPYGFFFLPHITVYQLQFVDHEYGWIEIREADYKVYNIGDLYPNKYMIAR